MRKFSVALILAVVMALFVSLARAQDDEDGEAMMSFVVLRENTGKPIRNASVVLHPVSKKGKQERGGLELKANAEGKCSYDGVPYGLVRVQVLAPGFQTFGQDYEVNKRAMEITIKLKRPEGQYSIYTDGQNDKKGGGQGDSSGKPQK